MKNLIKNISFVDLIIVIGIIVALFVGIATSRHFRQTADKQIEATSQITFQVFLRGVTYTGQEFPIKKEEKSFITIRNVPYTELKVLSVQSEERKKAIPSQKTKEQYVLIKDPAQPAVYDAIVTISDIAKITKDGAVVGGNKMKIGLPVTLEGANYKFNGTISDVRIQSVVQVEDDDSVNNLG